MKTSTPPLNKKNKEKRDSRPIIIAAGGTGGHIFPASCLAYAYASDNHPVLFITDHRFDKKYEESFQSIPRYTIFAASPSGSFLAILRALCILILGTIQCVALYIKKHPRAVVGFGGYPSFPPIAAAMILRIPIIIHEQNAVLGRVNRWFANKVSLLATSFPYTSRIPDRARVALVGIPVREAIRQARPAMEAIYPQAKSLPFILLVTGGSQAARKFGQVIPQGLSLLSPEVKSQLSVFFQCREDQLAEVNHSFSHAGVSATVKAFFTNMPEMLSKAHFVISRAGASSVAELTVIGRPSLLIPYPHAMDQHQTENARLLSSKEAAWMCDEDELTPEYIRDRILYAFEHREILSAMAEQAYLLGRIDAETALRQAIDQCKLA